MKLITLALLLSTTTAFAGTKDSIRKIEQRLTTLEQQVNTKVKKYDQMMEITTTADEMREFFEAREISFEVELKWCSRDSET